MNMKVLKKIALVALAAAVCVPAQAARIDSLSISSPKIPQPMAVKVVVPDALPAGAHAFPVVYMLNGYDGDCNQWLKGTPELPALADRYGMLMVLPSGMDSWYVDSPLRPDMQMASFITDELIPEIDRRYSTDTSRRAITGLSMGGHGAPRPLRCRRKHQWRSRPAPLRQALEPRTNTRHPGAKPRNVGRSNGSLKGQRPQGACAPT